MRTIRCGFFLILMSGLLLTACKRDMFDPDAYNNILTEASPFSEIDPEHDWKLTQRHSIVIIANAPDVSSVNCVCILNGNPFTDKDVEILTEVPYTKGETITLSYNVPTYLQKLYAAEVTTDGRWLLKSFTTGKQSLDFSADFTNYDETPQTIYQTYTYCYEDDYPEPGDNDFNDIVLRIQKQPAKTDNELRLRVTLQAVGTLRQVAAAINLPGYSYDDVESVTIEEGRVFDPEYSLARYFIKTADLLQKGIHGEAVLNLFEDAHYVMYPTVNSSTDGTRATIRRIYNTLHTVDGNVSMQAAPRSLTYVVKLRNPKQLQTYSLEDIDPFIMKDFNSGKWEIHTFAYKDAQVLHDLGSNETATCNNRTWALTIPCATFRYPQEEAHIGYYKDGILTGAYMTYDHSFGQWVANHNHSIDWFLYPSTGLVY